jgi:hypothetical protein
MQQTFDHAVHQNGFLMSVLLLIMDARGGSSAAFHRRVITILRCVISQGDFFCNPRNGCMQAAISSLT